MRSPDWYQKREEGRYSPDGDAVGSALLASTLGGSGAVRNGEAVQEVYRHGLPE